MTVELRLNTFRYQPKRRDDRPVRARIKEIANTRVTYGEERIYKLLRKEGWPDNHKRVRRIYREEALNLRTKRPNKSKASVLRENRDDPTRLNQCWAMDFIHDNLYDGRKFRTLTVVDIFSRFCIALEVRKHFLGINVVEVMERLRVAEALKPDCIRLDNGPEFISKDLDRWASLNNVTLDFSRKGKPTDNSYCESFNGSFRNECLNINWFMSMEDAIQKIKDWRNEYNNFRQHSSINDLTPQEMINKYRSNAQKV